MLAVGVDMIEVERIGSSLEKYGQRFLDRIFTEREQRYCDGRAESLAARFAAKEAVGKAMGTGIGDIRWLDIEIVNEENGQPLLVLHGAARTMAHTMGLELWSLSLSHTKTHAIGMVVAASTI
jgi:holo-[acyl-carrier protein] synthase